MVSKIFASDFDPGLRRGASQPNYAIIRTRDVHVHEMPASANLAYFDQNHYSVILWLFVNPPNRARKRPRNPAAKQRPRSANRPALDRAEKRRLLQNRVHALNRDHHLWLVWANVSRASVRAKVGPEVQKRLSLHRCLARQFARSSPSTASWILSGLGWPLSG